MSTSGNKPPPGELFGDGDDDLTELDSFGPMDGQANASETRVATMDGVSKKSGTTKDQDRARALNISMATTLIEPLPPGKVAYVELPSGATVILSKSVTVMGRSAGVADVVVDDDGVSRQHAAIIYAKGDFFIEDLGSSNGTKLAGHRVAVAQLAPGTEFSLGRHTCKFNVRER